MSAKTSGKSGGAAPAGVSATVLQSSEPILRFATLGLICLLAFSIRLFAVVRWESVIHEFDPQFNFRTTKYLSSEGFYDFLNWFDDRAWYPLGRIVGGTIYPGLMATAAIIHGALHSINLTINIRNMCVLLAPIFAANTAIATYLMTSEVTRRTSTGLLAAAMVAIVPSYISRSVGGSYDNEGVAIFALIFSFYTWIKAVNTGSIGWAVGAALAYAYMVAAWGGYVFIINIIPIYVVVMTVSQRFTSRLYVAYSVFYVVGSLLAMQVPFVGFNVIQQAESAASHGVFVLVQLYALARFVQHRVGTDKFRSLIWGASLLAMGAVAVLLLILQLTGKLGWTGRSLSLLDPTYAKKYIPIIASVSEHQPTAWTSFFFDLHLAVPFAPVGLWFLFYDINDGKVFLIIYGTISWYFAGVMVRLMLTLAPAACMLAAIGLSNLLSTFAAHLKASALGGQVLTASEGLSDYGKPLPGPDGLPKAAAAEAKDGTSAAKPYPGMISKAAEEAKAAEEKLQRTVVPSVLSTGITVGALIMLFFYSMHATYVSSEAYSSPSIVLASRRADGSKVIFDDFREAYWWLRQNTKPDARIMSWWDYGYQMSVFANRTVLVDNNTWNNTHIATVGRAMSSTEEDAYPIMQSLDVDYVLAIFGGLTGYQSDDINKFLWMVRIGGGVFPHIKEPDYFANGQYRQDAGGSPTMLNCMMYKMCYYRFDEVSTEYGRPTGFDRARNIEIGNKGFEMEHLEEAFTSEHWIVRIYKVKPQANRVPTGSAPSEVRRLKRQAAAPGSGKKGPKPKFRGCVGSESSFGGEKVYGGSTTAAHISLARHHAVAHKKRFFAVARVGGDGHAFAFDRLEGAEFITGGGCERPCMDDKNSFCGCADNACTEGPVPGEEHNRRWAVYEIPSGSGSAQPAAAARSSGKKAGKKGKRKGAKKGAGGKRRSAGKRSEL